MNNQVYVKAQELSFRFLEYGLQAALFNLAKH